MRFQRWPDGGNIWTWFIWSRHPKDSLTWTHSLSVSMERKGAWEGYRKWAWLHFGSDGMGGSGGFYFRLGRLHGGLQRQAFMPRAAIKGDTP
jgi:hypothetical protein